MATNNTKAMLAAMLSGTKTKETELMKAKTTGNFDEIKNIRESDLPLASELNYKRVALANGTTTLVEENSPIAKTGYNSVPTDAILGLFAGKKPSVIKEEMLQKEEAEFYKKSSAPSLTESIIGTSKKDFTTKIKIDQIRTEELDELVENKVYDILAKIVGEVNNNLKNKEVINEKLTEAITFLKFTKSLKG